MVLREEEDRGVGRDGGTRGGRMEEGEKSL